MHVVTVNIRQAHVAAAQVKLIRELFVEAASVGGSSDLRIFSCDNKNKVNMGRTAINRLAKMARLHLEGHEPKVPPHDFYKGLSLIPYGYMELTPKAPPFTLCKDDQGRNHYVVPHSGPSHVFIRYKSFITFFNSVTPPSKRRLSSFFLPL